MSDVIIPLIMWAQRKDNVYVTLSLSDCTDANVDITEDHLKFNGKVSNTTYGFDIELFSKVVPNECKWGNTGRVIRIVMHKDNKDTWPRLTKEKNTLKNKIQIDWDQWADSEDDEYNRNDLNGFNLDDMQQFGADGDENMDYEDDDSTSSDDCDCGCNDHACSCNECH